MKKLLAALLFLVWASTAHAGLPVYYTTASATSSNTTVTVDLDQNQDKAYTLTLINDGPNDVYVDLSDDTATTSNMKIKVGEVHTFRASGGFEFTAFGLICATGQTASVRVYAFPTK